MGHEFIVDEYAIQNSKCKKLLGIKIVYKLSLMIMLRKPSRKLHALSMPFLHEFQITAASNVNFYIFSIWVLPICLDVS